MLNTIPIIVSLCMDSAEFLWQEGHTAHATAADAVLTAQESLDMYASVCEVREVCLVRNAGRE